MSDERRKYPPGVRPSDSDSSRASGPPPQLVEMWEREKREKEGERKYPPGVRPAGEKAKGMDSDAMLGSGRTQHPSPPQKLNYTFLSVHPTRDNKWDANQAVQLMSVLYNTYHPFELNINVSNNQIKWLIGVHDNVAESVKNGIYSLYKGADVVETGISQVFSQGWHRWSVEAISIGIMPFPYANEFKIDPLTGIIQVMDGVPAGVSINYEMQFIPLRMSTKELREAANDLVYDPPIPFINQVAMNMVDLKKEDIKPTNADQTERAVRAKLDQILMDVVFSINIQAQKEVGDKIFFSFIDNFRQHAQEVTYNFLTGTMPDNFSLMLNVFEAAAMWHPPTSDMHSNKIAWKKGLNLPVPPQLLDTNLNGVVVGKTNQRGEEKSVKLPYSDRWAHTQIVGATGLGKSNLLHNLIHQDINNGYGVGVIDPHGDLIDDLLRYSIPPERHQDVILFDVSDYEYLLGMNIFVRPENVPEHLFGQEIMNLLEAVADMAYSDRMRWVARNAIYALIEYPNASMRDLSRILTDPDFRYQVLEHVTNEEVKRFWNYDFESMSGSQQRDATLPILNRISHFQDSRVIHRIMNQPKSLDFRMVMDTGKILLAKTKSTKADEKILARVIVNRLQMAAMSRGDVGQDLRRMFFLYIDELQNFGNTGLDGIYSEARKYKLALTTANQYLGQLDKNTLSSMMNNVGTKIIFGVGDEDAKTLKTYVGVDQEDLVKQGRGQVVVRTRIGGEAIDSFSLSTNLSPTIEVNDPDTIKTIINDSRAKYSSALDPDPAPDTTEAPTEPEDDFLG